MNTNYLKELNDEYTLVHCIDAKEKKTATKFTLYSFVILLLVATPLLRSLDFDIVFETAATDSKAYFLGLAVFLLSIFGYLVLHELVHGLFYKIFTHEKLTFGLTLTVAYCGVPTLYVRRKAAIITTLAPFVVFSIILGIPLLIIEKTIIWYLIACVFSVHISGCIGDIIVAFYMITKYRDKQMFVNDTGPKQTFYIKN